MTDVVPHALTEVASGAPIDVDPRKAVSARTLAREQFLVTAGQVAAGAGNLAFALLMVRVLDRRGFTHLAVFLASYLLIHLPGTSFGAGTALHPDLARGARRRALGIGVGASLVLAGATPFVASALRLPVALPLLLAAAAPTAALLPLERGRLYGTATHAPLIGSLAIEPVVRLTVGVLLAQLFGAPGAALGVVLAGYVALAVAWRAEEAGPIRMNAVRPHATIVAFLLLAVLQNEDLLVATRLLPTSEAARFAALSTLGGIAAFATATIPLVLLPRVLIDRRPLRVALVAAAALGGVAVAVVAVAPSSVVSVAFGSRYAAVAPFAARYMLAMALLGVVRVLVADQAARAGGRWALGILIGAIALHIGLILDLGQTAADVTIATLTAMSATTAVAAAVTVLQLPRAVAWRVRLRAALAVRARRRTLAAVGGVTAVALALRLAVTRGIWVDEAISVSQAHMPFGDMLRQLQATDVHPPLHAAILWVTVRAVGSSELAIRLPSIVAGTLVVPMLYLAGRELFDRRTGLIAAVLGAAFPLAVWYSQEARMYSLYMLFTTVAVFAQARALRRGRVQDWTLYGVATAALLWTQYLSVLVVLAQQVVFAVAILEGRRAGASIKRVVTAWLGSLALAAVLLAPLLPYVLTQFGSYKHRGAGLTAVPSQAGSSVASQPSLSVYSVIANLIWAAGGYHADRAMEQLSALWPLGMVVALALLGRRRSWASNTLLTLVVLPLGGLFLIGLQRPDLFELRYVAGVVPVAALIVARGTTVLAPSKLAARVAMCGVVIVLLALLADQQLNGANPRLYDFRGAVREVAAHARPGDQVLYSPVYLDAVVHYYGPKLHAEPIDGWRSAVRARGRIFVIGSFLEKRDISGHTGSVLAALEQRRRLVGRFTRPRIKVWEFE